ncbi:MAG: hypothetical protein Q7S33_00095 [Nanoarchaeota archaeon]|nr:hypothetical protein [Nanoarchaeota archaeon]
MVKSKENLISAWSFFIGVILAIVIGVFNKYLGETSGLIYGILVFLGFIVGFLIVGDKESMSFLFASVSLVIVSGFGHSTLLFNSNISPILSYLSEILSALLVMLVPATIIVAIKTVFSIAEV